MNEVEKQEPLLQRKNIFKKLVGRFWHGTRRYKSLNSITVLLWYLLKELFTKWALLCQKVFGNCHIHLARIMKYGSNQQTKAAYGFLLQAVIIYGEERNQNAS